MPYSGSRKDAERRRFRAMTLLDQGRSQCQVARALGVERSAVCVGLCGLAVGIGARLPSFGQTSAARIANGLGGTVNLLASIALVSLIFSGVGIASWRTQTISDSDFPEAGALLWCGGAVAFALLAGRAALRMGERHFERAEI